MNLLKRIFGSGKLGTAIVGVFTSYVLLPFLNGRLNLGVDPDALTQSLYAFVAVILGRGLQEMGHGTGPTPEPKPGKKPGADVAGLVAVLAVLCLIPACAPVETADEADPGSCGSVVDVTIRVVDVCTGTSVDGAQVFAIDETTGTVLILGDDPEPGTVEILGVTLCDAAYSITIMADGFDPVTRYLTRYTDTYEEVILFPTDRAPCPNE